MQGAEFYHCLINVCPCKAQTWEKGRFPSFDKMHLPTVQLAILSKPGIAFSLLYYYDISSSPISSRHSRKFVCVYAHCGT